jgi:hypothetical protein
VTKKKADTETAAPETPLADLILDCKQDKYRVVSLATRWAIEVQKREENAGLQPEVLVSLALKDILAGKVTMEEIEALPVVPKLVRRSEAAPVISEELAKRIAEEDARQEKANKDKKDEPLPEEEEEEE